MFNILAASSCADFFGGSIDPFLPAITSSIINVIKIGIPIILIFIGMLDLGKAVMTNDEKVMKAAQGTIIKRFVYAILIFLIVAIVQLVFGVLAKSSTNTNNTTNATACISCFINNTDCD